MNNNDYTVGLARLEHLHALSDIEKSAAAIFPGYVLPPEIRTSTLPLKQLEAAQADGRLWTALTKSQSPVGFAIVVCELNTAYLQEIDVHPAHQQKGLGKQLIRQVISWAEAHELACVTLTTFEYVPWNAPFYSKLGFRKLGEHELSFELLQHLHTERRRGLRQRVAMQLNLDQR